MKTTKTPYVRNAQQLGFIAGLTIKNDVNGEPMCYYFGGIPYAQPPVGPLRWKKPKPLPQGHQYGTKSSPGIFTRCTSICPQYAPNAQPDPALVDEDCLQSNIWLPADEQPENGWPVYFYIHGGSLQFGSPNDLDYAELLSDTNFKAVIVTPAYRLNAFGFVASRELAEEGQKNGEAVGNFGFWDQRLALEWTHQNIAVFGGDPSNITVAGYSAGAHSVFYQLSYDLGLPDDQSIIKRAVMHSNSTGMQPKYIKEAQDQFDELLLELDIPLSLSATDKLRQLRAASTKDIVAATKRASIHEYRSVTDGTFIRKSLFREVENGSYAQLMKRRGVHLWIGECCDEHYLYRTLRPPRGDSFEALRTRFLAEYPKLGAEALIRFYFPNFRLPSGWKSWQNEAFGHVWADIQVHMLQRGFISGLVRGGAADLIHRYRIEWRAKETDAKMPLEWGVTHSTDNSIWVYGEGRGLELAEKEAVKAAFVDIYAKFVAGEDVNVQFGAVAPYEVRRMKKDGTVDIWKDEMWERGEQIWRALKMEIWEDLC